MRTPDKIVLEHVGALGDFIQAWPVFVSILRHFPGVPAFAAVRGELVPFLAPEAKPCPPDLRRALEARYAAERWPKALEGVLVVRPGLGKRPELPESPWLWFLPGVIPGRFDPPRELYRENLAERGVAWAEDFAQTFRERFGGRPAVSDTALLFPEAGHPDKTWGLSRFAALARRLADRGLRPVFVLGPAEVERGTAVTGFETLAPGSVMDLADALRAARLAVGSDCGPMHLAGMLGTPGAAVFGPTSPRQWGPVGLVTVSAGLPCSPCVQVTTGDFAPGCIRPLPCLAAVTVEAVMAALESWLS